MKVTKDEFDTLIAGDAGSLGFCLTMVSGAAPGSPIDQHFLVDSDAITEIGRMTGYGINLLFSQNIITADESGELLLKWRKIVKE